MSNLRFHSNGGLMPSQARKVCRFVFKEYFQSMKHNQVDMTYDLYLYNGCDKELVKYFQEFWGAGYRIFKVGVEVKDEYVND